ncbi:MAG: hypothetical protein E6K11_01710 [Methanobacteriota archaeon]|nr:MAG: hypothetical protein E6K11_01710 [Euryarchaeota archaeon]
MIRNVALMLLLATSVVLADDAPEAKPDTGAARTKAEKKEEKKEEKKDDANLGMSILGNQEAPKALVIVPWKSSQIGASLGVSTLLDDSRQPIDKEVFMRALSYYEIRSETTRHDGAPAGTRPDSAAHGRK